MASTSQQPQETKSRRIISWGVVAILCPLVVWLVLVMASTPHRPISREKSLATFVDLYTRKIQIEERAPILEVVKVEPLLDVGIARVIAEYPDADRKLVMGIAILSDGIAVGSHVRLLNVAHVYMGNIDDFQIFKPAE